MSEHQTWIDVLGLVHRVYYIEADRVYPACGEPDLSKRTLRGYVYAVRSSCYLPDELSDEDARPATCLRCVINARR